MHLPDNNKDMLKNLLIYHEESVFKGYDVKVLAMCIIKQIFRESDIVTITELINISVRVLFIEENNCRNVKSKVTKKDKSSTIIKIRRVQDYQKILNYITTPFSNQNLIAEYEFKKVIDTMRLNNFMFYSTIIKHLPSQVREKLI